MGTTPRTAPAAGPHTVLAALAAAAGLVHLAAVPDHVGESGLHGAFFVVVGVAQVALAFALVTRGGRAVLAAGAAGSALVAGVWLLSRTAGVPVGPEAWTPEPVGVADVTSTLLEMALVAGAALLRSPAAASLGGRRLAAWPGPAAAAVAVAAPALLVLGSVTVVGAGDDGHGHVHDHGHEGAAAAHLAGGADHGHDPSGVGAAHGATAGAVDHAHGASPLGPAGAHAHGVTGAGAGLGAGAGDHVAHGTGAAVPGHEGHAASGSGHDHGAVLVPGAAGVGEAGTDGVVPGPVAVPALADVRHTTVRYGPVPLGPALLGTPATVTGVAPVFPPPCTDCFVTGTTIDLVYADGTSANLDTGPMLHHVVLAQQGLPDATCGPDTALGALGQRFFAAGNERTAGNFPAGFGYHLGRNPIVAVFDLMNHADHPTVVWFQASMSYVPDTTPGIRPLTALWLDQNNCGDSEYAVPAGASDRVWRWTSNVTGRIVAAAGHVHDGGVRTVLSNETTGRRICDSRAGYGTKPAYGGSVESMTTCLWDRIGTVRAGEVLAVDTFYDVPEAHDDVMGIMLAYVYETNDLAGGTEAPAGADAPAGTGSPPAGGHHH